MNDVVKALQTKSGIHSPDGVWGPNTYRAARNYFNLNQTRAAYFFGQCSVETGNFLNYSENLNYSAERLVEVFPNKFKTIEDAENYAHNPEKIANRIYANILDNGAEESGDGWKYRGRGAIQLTGKYWYETFSHHINKPEILSNPDIVATDYAFEAAMFYFDFNGIWKLCDVAVNKTNVTAVTKKINKALLGVQDRLTATQKFLTW